MCVYIDTHTCMYMSCLFFSPLSFLLPLFLTCLLVLTFSVATQQKRIYSFYRRSR